MTIDTNRSSFEYFNVCAGNPLSLQQLCRVVLRTMLGTRALVVVPKLDISQRIIDYLTYKS